MANRSPVQNRALAGKVMTAEEAAAFIAPGDHIGMSGFTGFGHPKAVPTALVRRVTDAAARGDRFTVGVWTGSSTAPELDGALAAVDGVDLRLPYQSDPVTRAKINAGLLDYLDIHLSHVAQMVMEGFLGHLDVALVEVAGVTEDGALIPSSSVGKQQHVDRHGRPGHPGGEFLAAGRTGRHARHLQRDCAAPAPHANPHSPAFRPDRPALPTLPARENHRRRPDAQA